LRIAFESDLPVRLRWRFRELPQRIKYNQIGVICVICGSTLRRGNMRTTQAILAFFTVILLALATPLKHQEASQSTVTIPVEITSYGGIVLQTRVNNSQPMSFYLDSGASSPLVINTSKARELGLKLQGRFTGGGGAGPNSYEFSETSGLTIALDQRTFTDQSATVLSLRLVEEQFGRTVDGLVGVDLFLNNVVEIDYNGKALRLYDPQSYVYSGAGESVPLRLRDHHLFVPAIIDIPGRGKLTGQFLVDTGGCMMTAILTAPFAQKNNLPSSGQKTIVDQSVAGLGGNTQLLVSRADHFKIGSSVLPSPLIYISQDKGGVLANPEYHGLLGTEILRKFKVIFDYSKRRLILERNVNFNEPLEYDMSGMSLRAYGDDFRILKIYQVLSDSPAAVAGLRVDDIIEQIDNTQASQLTL